MAKMKLALLDDGSLPIQVISVRLAAIWFAYEDLAWPDDSEMESITRGVPPWAYDDMELPPNWQKRADEYMNALCADIDAGRLQAAKTARNFPSRALDVDATLLSRKAIEKWGAQFDAALLHGHLWCDFVYNETGPVDRALDAIRAENERMRAPFEFDAAKEKAESMDAEQVARLIQENDRLRDRLDEYQKEPKPESPANSALLVVGRALELYLDGGPSRNQARFVADLQQGHETVRGLSDRTINGLLAKARGALADARKS